MRIALLADPSSWYSKDIFRAIDAANFESTILPFNSLTASVGIKNAPSLNDQNFDAVIVRSMPAGSLEQVVFRMDRLWAMESDGIPVINSPKSLECAIDKYLSLVRLEQAGLPIPQTIVCETLDQAKEAFDVLGKDVVIKPMFGSEGRGIIRVTDPEILWRTAHSLEQIRSVLYLQKFVPHQGRDFRVIVLNGKPLGTIQRESTADFRTNIAQSGKAVRVDSPDSKIEELACEAAAAIGAHFAAVDIVLNQDKNGAPMIFEVNGVPGWRAFSKVTGIDVAMKLIESLS